MNQSRESGNIGHDFKIPLIYGEKISIMAFRKKKPAPPKGGFHHQWKS